LFILHHAILGWPEWAEYSELVGIGDRSFDTDMGQNLPVDVATPDHPITRDLPSTWQIEDETYSMAVAAGSDGNEVLLTTEHEASMHTLAWTRQHERSRVFCFQCGHDNLAFANEQMRMVVQRGIEWCAGRI
jgi:type 1 glutamine amidotransferase